MLSFLNMWQIAYAAKSRGKGYGMRHVRCFSSKQFGNVARSCNKFSSCCKQHRHIILNCPTRLPQPTQRLVQAFLPLQADNSIIYGIFNNVYLINLCFYLSFICILFYFE